jgi:hypothetical protein
VSRFARLICVSLGVALAVWLLPASIHIVDWPSSGPVRVALLAPIWKLWAALAVAAIAAGAIVGIGTARGDRAFERIVTVISPLGLLWLWTIPYLPWIPDRAPVLLALAGPLRWGVVALALCGSVWASFASGERPSRPFALPGRRTAFTVSLALYLCFGLWSAAAVGPGADEPHYLVITQSLIRDHDLAIENNHARGDYREYFNGPLRPDFLRRGLNDVIYSIHAPGLPALLVPAYAVAGYRGAVVMLCLFAALAALAVFDLAELVAGRAAAWVTWAAVCLTVPFVPHSWLIFPEMPGALVTAWAALWLYTPLPERARIWIWRGLALALLPWLHTKFVILLAAMGAALVVRVWRRPTAAAALVTPIVISAALWLWSFYRLYGVLDPQVPYADFPSLYVRFANIPRGVFGLLFDQKFGLLVYAPVYLIAVAGCWMMLRRSDRRWFALALLATVAAFVASTTRMYMWWGGSSAPARFLVPILPLVAPMMAVAFRELRSPASRGMAALVLCISLIVAIGGSAWPERLMLFSPPHGVARLVEAVQAGSPLSLELPTFTQENVREPLTALIPWILAGLVALIVVRASRLAPRLTGFHVTCAAALTFVLGAAVVAGAPSPAGRRETTMRGRLELMHAYDGPMLRGFSYARRSRLDESALLGLSTLRVSRSATELSDDPRRLAGPFELPPGRYSARTWFGGERAREGTVFVTIRDHVRIAQTEGGLTNPATLSFDVPVETAVWVGVSDQMLANAVQQVEIVAESIRPRGARPDVDVRELEPIDGHPGAFIVYANTETYPEGGVFWTRSTNAGTVLVAPGGASTLVLTLHVGPLDGAVRVLVDGQDHSLTLPHDGTQQIEIPLPSTKPLVPVTVQAAGHFRPADHEAGSTDQRWLGCQVRIGLR